MDEHNWEASIPEAADGEALLTIDDAARVINATTTRVQRLVRKGVLAARRKDGLIYVLQESAEAYTPSRPRVFPVKQTGRPYKWARTPLALRRVR